MLIWPVAVDRDRLDAIVRLLRGTWASKEHLVLLFIDARIPSYQVHPFLSIFGGIRLKVVVARGGKEAKNMLALMLGVLQFGDGCKLGQVKLVS